MGIPSILVEWYTKRWLIIRLYILGADALGLAKIRATIHGDLQTHIHGERVMVSWVDNVYYICISLHISDWIIAIHIQTAPLKEAAKVFYASSLAGAAGWLLGIAGIFGSRRIPLRKLNWTVIDWQQVLFQKIQWEKWKSKVYTPRNATIKRIAHSERKPHETSLSTRRITRKDKKRRRGREQDWECQSLRGNKHLSQNAIAQVLGGSFLPCEATDQKWSCRWSNGQKAEGKTRLWSTESLSLSRSYHSHIDFW